eukprot:Nk52_evm2s372 gene=Nk52_evmTU2s372
MHCKVIPAADVAVQFREQLKDFIKEKGIKPKLVGFLANEDPAAKKYADWTKRTCEETGVDFEMRAVDRNQLEIEIEEANKDKSVHGMMVYYPVFGNKQDLYLQNCVSEHKDVEGLGHVARKNMYNNVRFMDEEKTQKCILPCTPLAIVKCLEYCEVYNSKLDEGNRLFGKTITIVNRSEIVGRPLAALLANDGATVYSIDLDGVQKFHRGKGIRLMAHEIEDIEMSNEEALGKADVVIGGVPVKGYKISTDHLKDGVVAINFASFQNFDTTTVKDKASIFITSVGKVTVTMLERNLVRCFERQTFGKSSF